MLIINTILFIFAVCSATHIATTTDTSVSSVSSTKLKRGTVDPDYDTLNNQERFKGTIKSIPRISVPQDINTESLPHYKNAKASDTQKNPHSNPSHRPGSHAYGSVPKRPFSYASSPIHQTASHYNSPLAPYFNILNNPSTYKAATSAEKPLDAPKSITSQSLQKLQEAYSPIYNAFHQDKSIELSDFSDFEYPSYSSIGKIISQGIQNGASSPTIQVPVYKTSYPLSKVTEYAHVNAPSFPIMPSATPLFQSSDKTKQNPKQNNEATVDVNGKKISIPIIQLQSNPGFSGVLPVFESQPFLLSADYTTDSGFGFNFGKGPKFDMALLSKNASPFLSPLSSFQGQVVPIQTASSTPQFPQYKGASIEVYPVSSNVPKAQGNYESLYSQPQLHFGKEHGGQPANAQQNTVHPSVSTEDILEDVEIINKKNPKPHPTQTDDDDEEDERYKNPEREYGHNSEDEDDGESGRYFKEPPTHSDFKPSISYPFKEYDERFGKHTAQIDDEDSEDKPHSNYKNDPSSNDDEEEENPSSDYRAESPRPSHDSHEEEDEEEEESHKYEKREETEEDSYEEEPKRPKYYGRDFEQEFEESYRKELPQHRYVHVKEVPEIDSYDNLKPSTRDPKDDNRTRVNHERPEDSKNQESRVSRKNRKAPKGAYRDSAAYGSNISVKKAPKVVYEEFFGYKNPETGKYSKHARSKSTFEKYSPARKTPKEDSYHRAAKYYKSQSPRDNDGHVSKNKYPYSYPSVNNRKSSQLSPEETTSRSNVRQSSNPDERASFYSLHAVSGQTRSLTNAEILRDLTGI